MKQLASLNRPDRLAIVATIALSAAGFWIGFIGDPAWAGRFGSLIVVVGILLAASRFLDRIQQQSSQFIAQQTPGIVSRALDRHEKERGTSLSEDEEREFRKSLDEEMRKDIAEVFRAFRERFKFLEALILIIGTVQNGFGEWLVCQLK